MSTSQKSRRAKPKEPDGSSFYVKLDRLLLDDALSALAPFVPRKSLAPYEQGVRIAPNSIADDVPGVVLSVASGFELHASVTLPADVGGLPEDEVVTPPADAVEVWDARRLRDMVRGVRGVFCTLDAGDRAKASVSGTASGTYRLPLYPRPEEFPMIEWGEDLLTVSAQTFLDALSRVTYAVGTSSQGPQYSHAQIDRSGACSGFNGAALQRASIPDWPDDQTLLVPEGVLAKLAFLRSPFLASELITVKRGRSADGSLEFFGLERGTAVLAYAAPKIDPYDLSRAWEVADEVMSDGGVLRLPVDDLLATLESAKVQADPRMPIVEFDLDSPVVLRAGFDADNVYENKFGGAEYSGSSGHQIRLGLYELQQMLNACPDEFVDLHIEESSTGNAREPYVQFQDSSGARAVVQQVRI